MIVLGIETSCDETGVAVINSDRRIMAHIVSSQLKEHAVFGGVVPEIAARSHLDHLDPIIAACMKEAGISFKDLDAVAATCGPGLIGGVMVGMIAGKAIAATQGKAFIPINHLEAHILSARLVQDIPFPYLVLLVSGGHTQILLAKGIGDYTLLGSTKDDAVGEAFDKSAKLMGLPYPGGPHLEMLAQECTDINNAIKSYPFGLPLQGQKNMDFSFSGLKTAIRTYVDKQPSPIPRQEAAMMAASFQIALAKHLSDRVSRALQLFNDEHQTSSTPALVVCGGVAANKTIRHELSSLCDKFKFHFMAPPIELCTDNGAMIAWAGIEWLQHAQSTDNIALFDASLSCPAYPRWPLESLSLTNKQAHNKKTGSAT